MAVPAMSQPPPFLNEIGEPEVHWKDWINIFASYLIAIGGERFSPTRKQHVLLHNLGIHGRKIFETLPEPELSEEEEEEVDVFKATLMKLETHFGDKINVVLERHKFFPGSKVSKNPSRTLLQPSGV